MKGRKPLFEARMKSNGLPQELDSWYKNKAQEMSITVAALKRRALESFKYQVEREGVELIPKAVSTHDVTVEETVG
jgi:hypothetical protein